MSERIAVVAIESKMTLRDLLTKVVRKFNSFTCVVMNGKHELYTIRNEGGNVFQRCLLCKHETKGWDLVSLRKSKPENE